MTRRIFTACLGTETNSFSPIPTGLSVYQHSMLVRGGDHGEAGFLRFSHQKAVFVQARWSPAALLQPPFGARFDRVMEWLRRWGF